MSPTKRRHWRPSLGQVVFIVLATVLALPLVGLFFFRLYENQLIRDTEGELIAQSAAIAAIFAQNVEALPSKARVLGPTAALPQAVEVEDYQPIVPSLDLAAGPILPSRPEARSAKVAPMGEYYAIGTALQEILRRTQSVTLAGFRLLDTRGVVISGREEIGQSLAHIEEVSAALQGSFRSMLRVRAVDRPVPPLYSLSRGTGVRIFTAMPVVVDGRVAGVVYASRTPDNILKAMYAERKKYIFAGLTVLLVTLAIGLLFARLISRPISDLMRRAGEMGRRAPNLSPIRHYGTREIAALSDGLNDMAQRLNERSDYIATFAAHVSHEIKTPLTSIQGASELMRDTPDMKDEERQRFLGNIIADTARLTAIVHRLRELARADNPQTLGSTSLHAVAAALRTAFPGLRIEMPGGSAATLPLSQENAMIVLSHLADNAQRHGADMLTLSARETGKSFCLTVADNGGGISEGNREKVFEAFFTTRRESGGTGMGLGIVQAMLYAHGGKIALGEAQTGTAFEIVLPVQEG